MCERSYCTEFDTTVVFYCEVGIKGFLTRVGKMESCQLVLVLFASDRLKPFFMT